MGLVGAEPNPRADERSDEETAYTERTFYIYSPDPSFRHEDLRKSNSAGWVERVKEADGNPTCPPPAYLILYRELLEEGRGWDRLVPYSAGSVEWSEFMDYLETYLRKNSNQIANLCNCQNNELIGQDVTAKNFIQAAAVQCIETGNMLIRTCLKFLTAEDIYLSGQIKRRARFTIQSDVVSSATSAFFACVIKEAELICKSVECHLSETITFSNEIRRSALNLMLYVGTESQNAAAAAAMVGMAKEAKYLCDLMSQESPDTGEYLNSDVIRTHTATFLTMLEKEFGCESDGNADVNGSSTSNTSEKPIGVSAVSGLNGDGSGSEENSRGIIEHCVKDNAKEELSLIDTKGKDLEGKASETSEPKLYD